MYPKLFPKRKKNENKKKGDDLSPKDIPTEFNIFRTVKRFCDELNMKPEDVYKMNYFGYLNWILYFNTEDEVKNNNRR